MRTMFFYFWSGAFFWFWILILLFFGRIMAKVDKKEIWDVWDYHGPIKASVQSTFTDKPLQKPPQELVTSSLSHN